MWLKNYYVYKLVRAMALASNTYGGFNFSPAVKTCDGTDRTAFHAGTGNTSMKPSYYYNGLRTFYTPPYNGVTSQSALTDITANLLTNLIVGSGTTSVTPNDYCVENEITTGLTSLSVNVQTNFNNGTINYLKTMQNSGESALTITEIGFSVPWVLSSSYSGQYAQLLVYREVLDTPISVDPGVTFTMQITLDFPLSA